MKDQKALLFQKSVAIHPWGSTGVLFSLPDARQCRQKCQHGHRQTPPCSLSTNLRSGKASSSSGNREVHESGRCFRLPSRQRQRKALYQLCLAWSKERAGHRAGCRVRDSEPCIRYCSPTPVVQRVVATLHTLEQPTT